MVYKICELNMVEALIVAPELSGIISREDYEKAGIEELGGVGSFLIKKIRIKQKQKQVMKFKYEKAGIEKLSGGHGTGMISTLTKAGLI